MNHEEWRALPFADVRIEHDFPSGGGNQTVSVRVDGKPIARLAVAEVGFECAYRERLGYLTLKLLAGDTLILTSRPKLPGDKP